MREPKPPLILPWDSHNQALVANVHPADWGNPTPAGRYNLVVIGGGTAGLVTAAGAAGLGAKVALIEKHLMGGDCLNVGCVPSKAIIRAARAVAAVREAAQFGVHVPPLSRASATAQAAADKITSAFPSAGETDGPRNEGVAVDFAKVMERMRRLRADIGPHDSARRFSELGVDVFLGTGRFTGPDAVEVGGQTLRFAKAVIATGARAAAPPIPGLSEAPYLTNETLFSLTELPRRFGIIGAGPIGCEMAQSFARFGSKVFLIEAGHGVLPREDRDAAEIVRAAMERDGVKLLCCGKDLQVSNAAPAPGQRMAERAGETGSLDNAAPLPGSLPTRSSRVEGENRDGIRLRVESHGQGHDVCVDQLLVAVGRAPNVEDLGLETAGVEFDKQGVKVNDRLQTTNPRIYACGDICSPYQFTHAADFMARIVIQNALFQGRARVSSLIIPWATYTSPEIAHAGLYEREALARGIEVDTFTQDLSRVDRALLDGETAGFVRVHTRKGTDTVVGATVVAAHAGELIGELTLAMQGGLGLKTLGATIHPYPTVAEAMRKTGDLYNRTRLTPWIKALMQRWLAWQR